MFIFLHYSCKNSWWQDLHLQLGATCVLVIWILPALWMALCEGRHTTKPHPSPLLHGRASSIFYITFFKWTITIRVPGARIHLQQVCNSHSNHWMRANGAGKTCGWILSHRVLAVRTALTSVTCYIDPITRWASPHICPPYLWNQLTASVKEAESLAITNALVLAILWLTNCR